MSAFSDEELERYARHIILREVGGPGQTRLRRSSVLVIGAGGLGSPALLYLAAAGVGRLVVVDDDHVSLSNLQRQIIHRTPDVGRLKIESAAEAVQQLNPGVDLRLHPCRFTMGNAEGLAAGCDVILDGSDNFETRRLVNRTAAALGLPWVFGAIGQWEGQVAVFPPTGRPCYDCVFPADPAPGLAPSCAEGGVLGALAGVVGSLMAVEALKLIVRTGEPLTGRLMLYDALYADTRLINTRPRPDCPVCGELQSIPGST